MNYADIHTFVRGQCPQAHLKLGDFALCLPTEEWTFGPFLRSWREKCIAENIIYIPGKRDCENIAGKCADHARECHARTPGNVGNGFLFGPFWYQSATLGPHGIDCIITTKDGMPVFRFLECQMPARQLFLTKDEIRSCTEIEFT